MNTPTANIVLSFTRAGSWGGSGGQDPPARASLRHLESDSVKKRGTPALLAGKRPTSLAEPVISVLHRVIVLRSAVVSSLGEKRRRTQPSGEVEDRDTAMAG